jgi:hypothetical protein
VVREDAEALRRRLYAPGAAGDDVERYRAAGGGAEAAPPRQADRPPPRGRIRFLVAAAILAALVVSGLGIARLTAPTAPVAAAPTPLAVTPDDRRSFEDELASGNAAGIAAYLLTTRPMPRFRGTTRIATIEGSGIGKGTVTLSPVDAEAVSGRATVLLVLEEPAEAGWTTYRRRVDPSGEQDYVRQTRRAGMQQAGVLTAHTYRYGSGDRPVELRVDAPDGVRWGAAVVFTD